MHETLNLAALYRLPLVLVCENNLYASHLHWSERRVLDNLDRAGEFHGVPGERTWTATMWRPFFAGRYQGGRERAAARRGTGLARMPNLPFPGTRGSGGGPGRGGEATRGIERLA